MPAFLSRRCCWGDVARLLIGACRTPSAVRLEVRGRIEVLTPPCSLSTALLSRKTVLNLAKIRGSCSGPKDNDSVVGLLRRVVMGPLGSCSELPATSRSPRCGRGLLVEGDGHVCGSAADHDRAHCRLEVRVPVPCSHPSSSCSSARSSCS